MPRAAVFDEIYANYLAEVAAVDLDRVAARLGLERDGEGVVIPFYGCPFRVSGRAVADHRATGRATP